MDNGTPRKMTRPHQWNDDNGESPDTTRNTIGVIKKPLTTTKNCSTCLKEAGPTFPTAIKDTLVLNRLFRFIRMEAEWADIDQEYLTGEDENMYIDPGAGIPTTMEDEYKRLYMLDIRRHQYGVYFH